MPYIHHPAIQWPLVLASLMVCAYGSAQTQSPTQPQNQIQAPTAANPYPMPPRTVLNGPYTPAAPSVVPKPAARPKPPVKPKTTKPSPAPAAKTASPAAPSAPSLLNQPSQAAKVSLASGKLTIDAHNSSLSDILRQVAKAGGMKLDGLHSDERVFGKYGPGAPRAVLSELLNGSGYNVLMAGETPSGTPRELSLSTPTAGAPSGPSQPANTAQSEDSEDDSQPAQDDQEPESQPQEFQDQESQPEESQPQPPSSAAPNGVRTPEQILQELERMRQQHQQPR